MYQPGGLRFAIGRTEAGEDDCLRSTPDLPDGTPADRRRARRALIGDPRNDENLLVAQFHLAVLKYHNAIVSDLEDAGNTLARSDSSMRRRVSSGGTTSGP